MEADVLNILKSQTACLSGGVDLDSNILIIYQLPHETQPWTKRYIEVTTKYLLNALSDQTLSNGLVAIVDTQKCPWRVAREQIKFITQQLEKHLIKVYAIRSDAFSVQNCAKSYKKGEPIIISKSRLNKLFNLSELPTEIGGLQHYNHEEWIRNRIQIDDFTKFFSNTITSIKSLKANLSNTDQMRSSEIEQTIMLCSSSYDEIQRHIKILLDNGNKLISSIGECQSRKVLLSQDILDAKEAIKSMLNEIEQEQTSITISWNNLEKNLGDVKELMQLEEGVTYVINWILSTAESLLSGQQKVGYDVQSAEKLRLDHEILELQCFKTYGFYGELLYKIDNFPGNKESFAYKDLLSQRDFMDFVCRSFATRLERRRNLLITSVRFYRLVAEYFQRTSNVFESLMQIQTESEMDNVEAAKVKLQKIKDSQLSLGNIEKELVKEGEKLSDILSMPIKDALGRDIDVDYSEEIANLREVLDAAKTRFKIFSDSLDVQKLTLEQITNIHSCERDAETAIKWVEKLYKAMLKSHTHIGCNVSEIQNQKDEHQAFQDTAKSTFNYGIQLLNAAFALRQSCKLSSDKNLEKIDQLKKTWKNLHAVSQEQMTRLRVSAVFYRSVDEHCAKLEQLKMSVVKLKDVEERERKIMKLRKYLAVRERLLVEVGRMVRLGKLLRTRLKEPFLLNNDLESMSSQENIIAMPIDNNSIATDSISAKLIEVSRVAESLDVVLHETQDALNLFESTSTPTASIDRKISSANTSDDWNNSLKSSTEDESFVTASEYATSRSSSYHTASECRDHSPWWTDTVERSSVDLDSSDPEQTIVKPSTSSGNGSFDNSEHSFRSPVPFVDQNDSDGSLKLKRDSESSSSPSIPPKVPSPIEDYREEQATPTILSDKKMYTIFESPTSSPSQIGSESPSKDGNSLHIKVTEVIPKFTFLGRNLDEALNLQKQHEDLLLNIQNLPTPLEEFYRKIQEKIAANEQQNPRLIEDMADSLSHVWSDILKVLHERRTIINLNVLFYERLGECYGKMSALECACRDTMIPIEVEAVREFLEKFKHLRVEVLSSIVNPLTVGNQLLEKLKEIAAVGSLDSRPDQILDESKKSVTLVETWLEDLSDKRNSLETAWVNRKIQLEQCLILAQLAKDLVELEKILNKQRDEVLATFTLGDSSRNAESLLKDYNTWKMDALALRDRSLKITKSTEEVVKGGSFIGEEACAKAYQVLAGCSEYLDEIDLRETWLFQSREFFTRAEDVMKKFDELEVDLKRVSLRPGSPNFIPVHLKLMQEVSHAINTVLELGYSLIDEVGRTKPEVQGVKMLVDEIERRKIYLESAFNKASEKHMKVSDELNIFLEHYNDIFSWIEMQKRDRIINGPLNFMGTNVHQAKECLNAHQQLLSQLEVKDDEFKNVTSKLKPSLEFVEDSQRDDVKEKINLLMKNWNDLNSFVAGRIPIIELYYRFHQEAEHLVNLFNNLEQTLKNTKRSEEFHYIDTVWNKIQTQFALLKSIAKHFNAEKIKIQEPYLQVDRAANCIEKTLDAFGSRQLEVSEIWEHFNIVKEVTIVLERIMAENVETLSLTAKIEEELYPILATSEELPSELIRFVENKVKSVLDEIKQSEVELSARIDKIDKIEVKDQVSSEKVVQVKNNLNSIKTKLFTISVDYKELVDHVLSFLHAYQKIYETIRNYFSGKDRPSSSVAPVEAENVANIIRDYETFKNNTMESFRSLLNQSEKLIDRIKMQEPPGAKENDTDKIITLLEQLRTYFETNAASENSELKRQYFVTEFEKMLHDFSDNINDLQLQFNDMSEKFEESPAACKVASLSFEYFERNVDLLNKRIETFINSYRSCIVSYPDTKPYVDDELNKLQRRWDDFKNQSLTLKNKLTLASQYFNLLETVNTRYHKTYTFLVNSVNLRKDELKSSAAAFELIDELEKYAMGNKQAQLEDLKKLSQISRDVFGTDKTENLYADNVFIFQSFEKMKSDIVELVKDLKEKEDPVAMINEIDNKILVIESTEESVRQENIHEIVPVVENEAPRFSKYLESAEVTEGETFVFECIVHGQPEPSIQWLKYNAPIGPSYKILFTDGKCRLEIPSVAISDAAVFSCIATNVAGTSQTTANLIVKQREIIKLTPPSFLRLLQNAYTNERSSFEFNCLVTGNPLPTVQWFRNDACIDNDMSYNITYNNGNATLHIPFVRVEDQGVFTVKAGNQVGHNECSAILSVEAVEKHTKPTIKSPLSNVMTRAGQKVTLECDIAGKPRPEIHVMHNGKQLSVHDVKLQYDGERVQLILPQASTQHSGIYRLIASNIAGEASTECFVSVEHEPILPEITTKAPSIQQPLKDISVFEGKSIQLEAIIVGQPEPEVIWLQNNKPVKESNDIQLYFQGDNCTLFINEAYLEDAGVYRVIAINAAGEASSECRVTVTPLNIAEPAIRPQTDRLVSSVMPPKFEKLLVDILANEGDTTELECCLVSGPLPDIKWYLNNKEIVYNERIQAVANEDGTLKLIIRNALPEDKGVYTVKATNSTGIAKCFSHLIVKSTANSSDSQLHKAEPEMLVCPTFKELFADRSVLFGDATKFECIVYGKPMPKIKWYFNDHPVHGRDFLISTSGDRQVLTIPKVTSETTGKISCIAENDAGKATCVALLSLNSDGIPVATEKQFTTQEDISGSSFVTMQKHITTTTTTKQSSQLYGNGVPQSQFHSTTEQVDSSYKKVGDAPAQVSESKKFEEFRESSNEPPQTFAQKLLNFSKFDDKNAENIIAQAGQITTGKPIRRNVAPRFVTPLVGKIVDQGVDVVLEGIVDGYPAPTIEITKNDEKLSDIPGAVEIYYNLNKVVIKLFNVATKDAGRYSAIATNDAGSATSTADVVVKKSIFPPVFGRRLQAQVVKKGERVIMDVEITGTPEPQVTWFKDDQPLDKNMTNEYRIVQLGICHKLILENVKVTDSGKYMVRAINSGGEAQSIADFMVLESQPDRMVEVTKTMIFSDLPTNQQKSGPMDQPKLPAQNGFAAHQEFATQAQLGSSTESKVIMETTRTTSATMRLEHKSNFPDLPPVTLSQRTQTPTIPSVSEGTMVDSDLRAKQQSEATQTAPPQFRDVPLPPKEIPYPFDAVDGEPIRKSAFEYFENNLKTLPALSDEKYTRFEEVKKGSKTYVHKQEEIKQHFHSKLNDDLSFFNLKPEPAPELGFMPKIEHQVPEKIVEKVKKLEEIHQTNEAPLSGTVFPQGIRKEEKYEKKEFISTKSTSPFPVHKPLTPQPMPSYLPQPNRDQLNADIKVTRSPSPKPSMEAVNMEKLWTTIPKSPEPYSQYNQQQTFTHEHKSSFVAYSSQKQQEFIEQGPSKENFVPIQPYQIEPQNQEELPKASIKDTKSFFEQRIKQEAPVDMKDLKAPGLVKQFAKPMVPLVQPADLGIEPGAPPEILYAPKPVLERKQSYVEKIEKTLEQNIEKEPDKVPRGGIRIFPQRQTPQRSVASPQRYQAPPSPKPLVPEPMPEIIKPQENQYQYTAMPAQVVPEPFVSSKFETKSENVEIKKESESISGFRRVDFGKFLQQQKTEPAAPIVTQVPIVSQPAPFVAPPLFSDLFKAKEPEILKPQEQVTQIPVQIQRQEPPKPILTQPKPTTPSLPKPKFGDQFVSETTHQQSHSMYKNFVRSEKNVQSSESYFQRIESPKTIVPQQPQQPLNNQQQQFSQESKTTQLMKNISMTSKQIKFNEESVPLNRHSDADIENKIQPMWRPSSEHCYKPVTPNLPPSPQHFGAQMQPPATLYCGPPRPKFEPIDKPAPIQQAKKIEPKVLPVYKPTPVTPGKNAFSNFLENSSQQSNQTKSYYYSTTGPQNTTTYYTGVAGPPVHNAVAHETSNTIHMKESSEQSHRVVNITQTRRVISLDKKDEEKLEPFPFSPQPEVYYPKSRVPLPPTPTKFVPGEFRESDYESEIDGTRIRPVWTPTGHLSESDEPHYRKVRPPSSRSSSVPPSSRNYDRVMTPMEFDRGPVVMPTKIQIESPKLKTPQQYFTSPIYKEQIKSKTLKQQGVTRDDIGIQSQTAFVDHASDLNTAFKTKAHQFMKDVMSDQQKQHKPILKKAGSAGGDGQAYREESRVSQYGTKHVDPNTGIIYFKYDFGYEFGVIFEDGRKVVGGVRNGSQDEAKKILARRTSDIEVPVLHEKTGRASVVSFGTTTPIEFERLDKAKKRFSLPTPNYYGNIQSSDYSTNNPNDRSGSNTPSVVNAQKQGPLKNPPMFITPLKDIAVVAGQTARFECIVQCDPTNVYWMKDGQVIENSFKFQIEFRNGVCRCTIPQASKDDAGTYECVAQNHLGTDTTRGLLIIPGDKRGFRIY